MKSASEIMDQMAAEGRALWKVEPCTDCGSMKPRGERYHAPLMRTVDVDNPEHPRCRHVVPYYRTCRRVVPPPCCRGEARTGVSCGLFVQSHSRLAPSWATYWREYERDERAASRCGQGSREGRAEGGAREFPPIRRRAVGVMHQVRARPSEVWLAAPVRRPRARGAAMTADDMARDLRAAGWEDFGENYPSWSSPGDYYQDLTLQAAWEVEKELAQQRERGTVQTPVVGEEEA